MTTINGHNGEYNPDYGRQYVDSGDYTWTSTTPPMPTYDTRTHDERTQAAIANLQTSVQLLTDEVQHLREDIARMKTGESEL